MQRDLRLLKNWKLWTGTENYEEDNSIPEDKVYASKNARFTNKVITSKPGYQGVGYSLAGGTKMQGIWEYPYDNGTDTERLLIGCYNHTLYEFNFTTLFWDGIAGTWPNLEDKPMDATVYGNTLYLVGRTGKTGNGIGKISRGHNFTFTVAGVVTTPDVNAVYQISGAQYVVISTNIVAGAGTIVMKRSLLLADPAAAGTLDKFDTLYAGDLILTYSSWVKTANPVTNFTVIPNSPEGTAIDSFCERLVTIGDPSFPGQLLYSEPAADINTIFLVENWDTTAGASTFLVAKNTILVAIETINTSLYIWNSSSVFEHTNTNLASGFNPVELSRTTGTINAKSVAIVENDAWFFNNQNQVRSLGNEKNLGEEPRTKSISEIIQRTMGLLDPVQDNPAMSYYDRVLKIALKTKGSPTNNIILVFDYNTGGFGVDFGQAVNCYVVYNGNRYYGEDATSNVFQDDVGYTANGAGFPFQVDFPFEDSGRPDTFKQVRYIYVRGKQSYYQPLTVRLYRGNYQTYSDYIIPSPYTRGISLTAGESDASWGSTSAGSAPWGGSGTGSGEDLLVYRFEQLISVSRIANMFSIGLLADINGGKIQVDQVLLKVIDENENYKPSDR
jgi:hypothetical protein